MRTLFNHPIREETTGTFYPTPWTLEDFEQLRDAAWAKLEVNKARTWAKPTKGDEAVEHVRD